jgi:hypothetical protein
LTRPTVDPKRERARLRRFGLTVGIAFLVVGALLLWRHRAAAPFFGAAGGALLLLTAAAPIALRPIERVWMTVALAMGWVMTRVVLGLIFVLVFTPAGLARRLLRRDPMELRLDRGAASYWHRRPPADAPERMEKMF